MRQKMSDTDHRVLPEAKVTGGGLRQDGRPVWVHCPYCQGTHIHSLNLNIDLKDNRTMSPRLADCGKGEYVVAFSPKWPN